jgi:hypothetical protein
MVTKIVTEVKKVNEDKFLYKGCLTIKAVLNNYTKGHFFSIPSIYSLVASLTPFPSTKYHLHHKF